MSGYWLAIAAAARGGAGGLGAAVPVPAPPVFGAEAGDEGEDWGALDIEEAAPSPSTVRRMSRTAPVEPEQPLLKADGKVLPSALEHGEASLPVSRTAAGEAPPELSEAHPVAPTPQPDTDVALSLRAPVIPLAAEPAGPRVGGATEGEISPVVVTLPRDSADGTALPADSAPMAAASVAEPVRVDGPDTDPVEATPVVQLTAIDDRLSGDAATIMMDDAIQPIHVHIDRIDIRLDVAASAPATATPRRAAAPVVALDDFLRRPAERGQ